MPQKRRRENLLLAALPEAERERLDPFLTLIEMQVGMPVTEPDEPIPYLYFPYDAVTSTTQEMSDGSMIETGLMGIEGLAGVQVWLGQRSTAATTFVQVPGTGHRMATEDFIREVRDNAASPLNDLVRSYVHAFLVLTSLVAACNRLHPIDQRLCRWLCMTYNRARRTEYPLRHEFLSQMLGVQRPTLSTAASMLQRAGLITYRYGKLTITNPDGLVTGACECYALMESQFDKIFDQPWRARITLPEASGHSSSYK
ncbi:MAG TPA: Crp/Fnr family transcriptional regulator [Terriglobales bacterium]|nr:Crp/Fnr family transcriptional regulator [Terriglobales bacterium]